MEEHPIPHSITTFEFKLIGFLSVKQFLYLLFFGALGYLFFLLIAIPYVNLAVGITIASIGAGLAFISYNGRSIDVHIKNLYKRLTAPSQYYYQKSNSKPNFFQDLHQSSDQRVAAIHADANEKVAQYLKTTHAQPLPESLVTKPEVADIYPPDEEPVITETPEDPPVEDPIKEDIAPAVAVSPKDAPFLEGYIKNKKELSLPDIIVYLKDSTGKLLRIMKTNHAGYFATFHDLPAGGYILEPKDTRGKHFFDTMNITVQGVVGSPITIHSKEIL